MTLLLVLTWAGSGRWGWTEPMAVLPGSLWLLAGTALLAWAVMVRDTAAALLSLPVALTGGLWTGVVHGPPAAVDATRSLRVIAWNVTYLPPDLPGKVDFFRGLIPYEPDLLLLQEAHLDRPGLLERELRAFWPDVTVVNRGEYTLISRHPVLDHGVPPGIGGFMWARVQVGPHELNVYNLHYFSVLAAFERRVAQHRELLRHLQDDDLVLIGGDLNVPWHHRWTRELRERYTTSHPSGWSLPLTLPGALPLVRVDYVFASGDLSLHGYRHLPYRSGWRDHMGMLTIVNLPPAR